MNIDDSVDFLARLAASVPKPRVNLTGFHGVFAPNSKHRIQVTPAKRGKGRKQMERQAWDEKTPLERHAAMTWMQRLKRVFNIDIEICEKCRGPVKIIACVEDPVAIEKILKHLKEKAVPDNTARPPPGWAPPQIELFDRSEISLFDACCQGRRRGRLRPKIDYKSIMTDKQVNEPLA